ncbi:MAG: hypothetical protein H0V95_10810 [Actinobacteria bacterium]|nr:hypothetical protein [Actinomycetota bacterium]
MRFEKVVEDNLDPVGPGLSDTGLDPVGGAPPDDGLHPAGGAPPDDGLGPHEVRIDDPGPHGEPTEVDID